jgi:hypothetical protein
VIGRESIFNVLIRTISEYILSDSEDISSRELLLSGCLSVLISTVRPGNDKIPVLYSKPPCDLVVAG